MFALHYLLLAQPSIETKIKVCTFFTSFIQISSGLKILKIKILEVVSTCQPFNL